MNANSPLSQPEDTMAAQKRDKQHGEHVDQNLQDQYPLIRSHLMSALGSPGNLQRVQVRRLWENHYRVNVLIGADIASVKVAHSYFVEADDNGTIITSTPEITRQY
jgi:hypothetical protein